MTYKELYTALRRLDVEPGSLPCLGCEWAQDCGVHGCRILRAAAEAVRKLKQQNDLLPAKLAGKDK